MITEFVALFRRPQSPPSLVAGPKPGLAQIWGLALALSLLAGASFVQAQGPARGYADLHAHWFSHLANGGLTPFGDLAGVYCPDDATNGHTALGDQADCALAHGDYFLNSQRPLFDKETDQKAFYEWIKRAWKHGQRLAVVMANYNDLACTHPISGTHRWIDGRLCNANIAIADQVAQVKKFADWVHQYDPDDWLHIAETPAEARSLIRSGKMAVVLGVEVDDLFQCGRNACSAAEVVLKVMRLHSIGVRHVIPIHSINNDFGGPAFFQELYGLSQWIYNHAPNWFDLRECSGSDTSFKLWGNEGFGVTDIGNHISGLHFSGFLKGYYPLTPFDAEWNFTSHCNVLGLTSNGQLLVETMMRLGMLIDVDHMSERAFDATFATATDLSFQASLGRSSAYPLVSSHTSIRDMLPDRGPDFRYVHTGERNNHLSGEMHKSVAQITKIASTGGIIAPILTQRTVRAYTGPRAKPANDCTDSSRSWAQIYLRSLDLMGGQNVALGTDVNGAAPMPGPRFGLKACGEGRIEGSRALSERTAQAKRKDRLIYGTTPAVLGVPLNMSVTSKSASSRTFDLNTIGVAHYGMVPDFIADLETIGLAASDLDVLMNSAEAYIDVWEAAQPNFDFKPFVSNTTYHGLSATPPAAFVGAPNCPNNSAHLGQDARWWEFEIDFAEVDGFSASDAAVVSSFPFQQACILNGSSGAGLRVAVAIAPKIGLAAYDSEDWQITITDALSGNTQTKGVAIEVPRPKVEIARLSGSVLEPGDCPAGMPEEEPGGEREIIASALYRPTGMKLRQDVRADITTHTADFVPTTFDWVGETPFDLLGNSDTVSVEFCPCGKRWVEVTVEELAGVETIQYGFLLDAPELSLDVQTQHYDQFGTVILDPTRAYQSAARIDFAVSASNASGPPVCAWPELRWTDPGSTDPINDETPVPAGRLQPHGDGCTSTLTVWDPATDPGSEPWAKRIRGVVTMLDGSQCGAKLFAVDTDLRAELRTHDFKLKPLKPLKLKMGNSGLATKTVKLEVANVVDGLRFPEADDGMLARLEVTNLTCPEGVVTAEPVFDQSDSEGLVLFPGHKAKARFEVRIDAASIFSFGPQIPVRCEVEIRAVGEDGSDPTPNNAEILVLDIFDKTAANIAPTAEIIVRSLKRAKVRAGTPERPRRTRVKAIVENRGSEASSVFWELDHSDCKDASFSGETVGEIQIEPGKRAKLSFFIAATTSDYPTASEDSPHRCHLALVADPASDLDPSNNAAATYVEIFGEDIAFPDF